MEDKHPEGWMERYQPIAFSKTQQKCRRCGKPLHLRPSCEEWSCPELDALRLKDQPI